MSELSDARLALTPLRRYWWVVALAALAAGVAAFVASVPPSSVTYGVVNTRTVASLPNDRIDLITDLGTVISLPSVLEEPAKVAGVSVDELRDDVTVERIGSTTLARITFTSADSDRTTDEQVITALVDSAAHFLGQTSTPAEDAASGPLQQAEAKVADTADAMAAMVAGNGGVEPDREYDALQGAAIGGGTDRSARLQAAFEQAQKYDTLREQHSQAVTAVATLQAAEAQQQARQANLAESIPVSFEGDVTTSADVLARGRRVLGAAAAGAVLGAAVVMGIGALSRRRRHDPGPTGSHLGA